MTNIRKSSNTTRNIYLLLPISAHHHNIHVYMEFFYVNKIPLLNTKSNNINLLTIQSTSSRANQQIIIGMEYINEIYTWWGFIIAGFYRDNKFDMDYLRSALLSTTLRICKKVQHIKFIEIYVRTIKEMVRRSTHTIPYRRYPKLMNRSLV